MEQQQKQNKKYTEKRSQIDTVSTGEAVQRIWICCFGLFHVDKMHLQKAHSILCI